MELIERNVHGEEVVARSWRANCGPVDEAMVSAKRGDEVPMPRPPVELSKKNPDCADACESVPSVEL